MENETLDKLELKLRTEIKKLDDEIIEINNKLIRLHIVTSIVSFILAPTLFVLWFYVIFRFNFAESLPFYINILLGM